MDHCPDDNPPLAVSEAQSEERMSRVGHSKRPLDPSLPEKTQIWLEIRDTARIITRAGGDPIEVFIWSQGR